VALFIGSTRRAVWHGQVDARDGVLGLDRSIRAWHSIPGIIASSMEVVAQREEL
jgi:hypothetical protein